MNKVYWFSILLFLGSCIDPYVPEINESQNLLVVNGFISNVPGEHTIRLSRSSSFDDPMDIPQADCVVQVENNDGIAVGFNEDNPGIYKAILGQEFLGINKAYRIYIKTPDGDEYISDFDTLHPCPEIDSLYYVYEERGGEEVYRNIHGIQFYIDVKGKPGESQNYMWKMDETYEYHSEHLITYYWDGFFLHEFHPAIDSFLICYKTEHPSRIFTTSTRNLSMNELNAYPLNYVSNETVKLKEKYSMLLRQYSLSDKAYEYWDALAAQISESGGLYEKQPSAIRGNIHKVNDESEQVMGFFYATQLRKKRIFVTEDFKFPFPSVCAASIISLGDYKFIPLYLTSYNDSGYGFPYIWGGAACFDCRALGGKLNRPDFWDDDGFNF